MSIPLSVGPGKGGALDHEGEEHTHDVDGYTLPCSAIVPVLKIQVTGVAGQLLLR